MDEKVALEFIRRATNSVGEAIAFYENVEDTPKDAVSADGKSLTLTMWDGSIFRLTAEKIND